ncbi:MAG: trehalose-6-phosphate synthase [Candidatus Binatia bacterium]
MNSIANRASPLTVISNRAPYQLKKRLGKFSWVKNVGGLVSVLDEIMCKGGGTWIAWGDQAELPQRIGIPVGEPKYFMDLVQLTDQEVRNYYQGFSNRVLWPISHYSLDRCHFQNDYWKAYQGVNEKFAKVFLKQPRDSDAIWIHDFHLALLPALLRETHQNLSIGFFWHIPFPSSPVFRVLPWRREILLGLLGSDLIGFQLGLHARNFLQAVEDVLNLPVDRGTASIKHQGRVIKVTDFPVGIDYRRWNELASKPVNIEKASQIRRELGVEQIIMGADRLDYTKGIRERLLAYERFLEKYPMYRGRVCMIQIAVPSRTRVQEYRTLRREIDETVGRISGRFSTRKWVPLLYLYKALPMEELVTYYSAADLALITPLRDGMNLVAEEYIAARIRGDGCLILSEFAGAAELLTDAVVVNPYNLEELADSIHVCLSMEEAEKQDRMQKLRRAVRERDVHWWCQSFLDSLMRKEGISRNQRLGSRPSSNVASFTAGKRRPR